MHELEKIIENTETACRLCEREFLHDEIINIIHTDNDIEKQICILKLLGVNTQEEADLLVFNLTNHGGIIREAAAVKINELMQDNRFSGFFQTESILDTLLDAIIDINPNICRLIIEVLPFVNDKAGFFEKLYSRALAVIDDAVTMNIRNKGYEYSRKVFKIFWYMEAVCALAYFQDQEKIKNILLKTYTFKDYTIREKAAKILSQLDGVIEGLDEIMNVLKNDENYFVRRFIK